VSPAAEGVSVRRLVIAAPQGRSGKTTVTVGLCAALAARGLRVQPFKKGPDYIDPSWLTEAAGRPCRNLDPYLMGQDTVVAAFVRGSEGADMAIVEGAMGLYDGLDLQGSGSTAALARWLGAPIILVVNAQRITRSVAALVQGYQHFEPETYIAGVILNNVARGRHQAVMTQAIEQYCGIPVVGALPRAESLAIPDRHLGLVPRAENEALLAAVAATRDAVSAHFDLERVLEISNVKFQISKVALAPTYPPATRPVVRIGVVRDRVFTFYYPENLEALQAAGSKLVFVDSLQDVHLPPVDALYIGGGFPEVFAARLEANVSLRADIRAAIEDGLPVYAECGGLMYLSRSIRWGKKNTRGEMVGALACDIQMTERPQGHGYVTLEVVEHNPFFPLGVELRGHEFHNSRLELAGLGAHCAFRVTRGHGLDGQRDGLVYKNVLATYTHLHALSTPEWAPALVAKAIEYRLGTGRTLTGLPEEVGE
jgi:cobyrinic acid a,c-diamide synthase